MRASGPSLSARSCTLSSSFIAAAIHRSVTCPRSVRMPARSLSMSCMPAVGEAERSRSGSAAAPNAATAAVLYMRVREACVCAPSGGTIGSTRADILARRAGRPRCSSPMLKPRSAAADR